MQLLETDIINMIENLQENMAKVDEQTGNLNGQMKKVVLKNHTEVPEFQKFQMYNLNLIMRNYQTNSID